MSENKYRTCSPLCHKDNDIICQFSILADETAGMAGLLCALVTQEDLREELRFVCGTIYSLTPAFRSGAALSHDEFARLESLTMGHKNAAPRPVGVVLPMGCQSAALAHVLRVKCKGLVRLLCIQGQAENSLLFDYANLLSGYFYYLAFKLNALEGVEEIPYGK